MGVKVNECRNNDRCNGVKNISKKSASFSSELRVKKLIRCSVRNTRIIPIMTYTYSSLKITFHKYLRLLNVLCDFIRVANFFFGPRIHL